MSRKGKDVEPAAATAAPIPGMSDSNGDGHLGVHNGNGGGNNGGNVASGSGASPLMKRRPLITSSFSWSANGPAGGGGDGPIASSRPARAFKGSSSSFIRSWEGLPISQVQLRSFTEGNNGKDTIFGFQTQGKMVLWNHIGPGKKVRRPPFSRLSLMPLIIVRLAGTDQQDHLQPIPDVYRRKPAHRIACSSRRSHRIRKRRHSLDGFVSPFLLRFVLLVANSIVSHRPHHRPLLPLQ